MPIFYGARIAVIGGFEAAIQKQKEELDKQIKAFENMTEEEKKKFFDDESAE